MDIKKEASIPGCQIEKIKEIYKKSGIYIRPDEFEKMEITDFGLGDFFSIGLGVIIYVNTERVCAKELAMTPYQICPQHKHPHIEGRPGKEETFRCRWGEVYLYVEGEASKDIKGIIPDKYLQKFSVFHEILLKPGDQYTLQPDTWHWFEGGPEGAVLSEFSTHSFDEGDIFYDEDIERMAVDN
ncbi:MAG: D-lyxose/D-mannose family sugar isomerase [Actinobacteria bacterium]|nr:D-lyxose/D-mannose family sugar isomerase [Actinomycetota bacterium]